MNARLVLWLLPLATLLTAAEPPPPANAVSLRVRFGLKDTEPTDWSGSVTVTPGRVVSIQSWRWGATDSAEGNAWTASTRRMLPGPGMKAGGRLRLPMADNGVVITLANTQPASEISLRFADRPEPVKFKLSEIPYGQRLHPLQASVEVERCPTAAPIAETAADEDYPSAAVAKDGTVYVAYVAFTRGKDFPRQREVLATPEVKPRFAGPGAPTARLIASLRPLQASR